MDYTTNGRDLCTRKQQPTLAETESLERRKITHINKPTLRLTYQKSQQYNRVKVIQSTCIKKNHGQFRVHRGSNAVVLPAWLTTTISLAGLNHQLGNNWNFERWLEVQESYYLLFIEGIKRAPASHDDSRWRCCFRVPIIKAILCSKCSQIRTLNMKTIEDEEIFHMATAYSTSSSQKTQQNKEKGQYSIPMCKVPSIAFLLYWSPGPLFSLYTLHPDVDENLYLHRLENSER